MNELIAAVAGTLVGFVLGKFGEWWSQRSAVRERTVSVRALMTIESSRNAVLLEEYWRRVLGRRDTWVNEDGEFLWLSLAKAIIAVPPPDFSRLCWEANLAHLSAAYSGSELQVLWSGYERLSEIGLLHSRLASLNGEALEHGRIAEARSSIGSGGIITGLVSGLHFASDGETLSKRFYELVKQHIGAEKMGVAQHALAPGTRERGPSTQVSATEHG